MGGAGGGTSGGRGRRGSSGRRTPPPETTGAEAAYLLKRKEARTAMVVRLTDGETVRGVIEYYDRDMIKINREPGPNVFIRKSSICYMHEDDSEA